MGDPGFGTQEIPKPLGVRDDALNLFGRCPFEQFWGSAGHGGVLGVLAIGLKRHILRRVPKSAKTSEDDGFFFGSDDAPPKAGGARAQEFMDPAIYINTYIWTYNVTYLDL